jgi:hypothetical protein
VRMAQTSAARVSMSTVILLRRVVA